MESISVLTSSFFKLCMVFIDVWIIMASGFSLNCWILLIIILICYVLFGRLS